MAQYEPLTTGEQQPPNHFALPQSCCSCCRGDICNCRLSSADSRLTIHVYIAVDVNRSASLPFCRTQQVLQQRKFNSKASCMAMLPISADSQQRTAVMGFADGGVRLVRRCADGWRLLAAARPHKVCTIGPWSLNTPQVVPRPTVLLTAATAARQPLSDHSHCGDCTEHQHVRFAKDIGQVCWLHTWFCLAAVAT